MWDSEGVEARINEAASVLRRLPGEKPRGFKSTMPQPPASKQESWIAELEGWSWGDPFRLYKKGDVSPGRPSPQEITRMDEVLGWHRFVPPKEWIAVWIYAAGWHKGRWAKKLRCNRASIKRWRDDGIERIVRGLNDGR